MRKKESEKIILIQYRECYEYLRLRDRSIWEIPSLTVVINGALITIAFAYIDSLIIREVLIGIGVLLTLTLWIAVIRHRYFAIVEQGTLDEIERKLQTKHIQRTTILREDIEYWFTKCPRLLQRISASEALVYAMGLVFLLVLALLFHSLFM